MQYVGAGGEGDAGAGGAKALGAEQVHLVVGYPERHLGDVGGAFVDFWCGGVFGAGRGAKPAPDPAAPGWRYRR